MPLNSTQLCDIDSSFIGLLGVVLGATIIIVKDTIQNFIVKRKDTEYLAIRVTCLLEHFAGGCVEVVGDDGLCYGQRNEAGCLEPQIRPPQLTFDNLDVKWKSLSKDLMYELLNFPNEVDKANQLISFTSEYISGPPDYEEFFEEREFHFSKLGLQALDLSSRLRNMSNLPIINFDDFNPSDYLKSSHDKIILLRAKRESLI